MGKKETLDAIEIPIEWELAHKLQEVVALYALNNQIDLYELKGAVDEFYKRFIRALEP
jgi:hypothetical protein